MPNPRRPFRINVGFIVHDEAGSYYDFPFEFNKLKIGGDLELSNFSGLINIGRTPQGLLVTGNFTGDSTLECVRCLTSFNHSLNWDMTELYAFDERSVSECGWVLAVPRPCLNPGHAGPGCRRAARNADLKCRKCHNHNADRAGSAIPWPCA